MLPGMSGIAGAASAPSASISNRTVNGSDLAGYRLNASGSIDTATSSGGGYVATGATWGSGGADWECRASGESSALGTFDTWLALSTSRAWNVLNGDSDSFLVEIRPTGGATVTSATITLSA